MRANTRYTSIDISSRALALFSNVLERSVVILRLFFCPILSYLCELLTARQIVLEQSTPLAKQHTLDIGTTESITVVLITLDCIKVLGLSVVSKSVDGTIVVWDAVSGSVERRLKIKNPSESASLFHISTDGRFLVAGNSQGVLFVWNAQVCIFCRRVLLIVYLQCEDRLTLSQTGDQVTKLKYRRKESRSSVGSCGIAHDLKYVSHLCDLLNH